MYKQYFVNKMRCFSLCMATLAIIGCADTRYQQYEGNNNIVEGQGGTKTVVNGIEIWDNGTPPRKYKILGVIDDERGAGWGANGMMQSALASKAKEVGGDALVRITSNTQVTGYIGNNFGTASAYGGQATAFGTTTMAPVRHMYSKFMVIKYLN